jgi:uncharacterized DUF497 family protein
MLRSVKRLGTVLISFLYFVNDNTAIIISARDMSRKERKSYARK